MHHLVPAKAVLQGLLHQDHAWQKYSHRPAPEGVRLPISGLGSRITIGLAKLFVELRAVKDSSYPILLFFYRIKFLFSYEALPNTLSFVGISIHDFLDELQ